MQGYRCKECGFELFHPVSELSVSALGLYDDARFPGRCVLALREHEEHFDRLPEPLWTGFIADLRAASRAIRLATGAKRINFAVLGNVEPHVHAHLVPRGAPGDEHPDKTPWNEAVPKKCLQEEEIPPLIEKLSSCLT